MGDKSKIEWTDASWNPALGCSKVSPGCTNCYAETLSLKFQKQGIAGYERGFEIRPMPDRLDQPLRWKKSRMIFVNSMSDLFHKDLPLEYIRQVFDVMNQAQQHVFQILTKRHKRLAELAGELNYSDNIWQGVSVENADYRHRIDYLRQVPARVRFLSIEPLLGSCGELNLEGIHWVIVGGESGAGARPMDPEWAREVRDQCAEQKVPFFFKQHGGVNKKAAGRELDGRTWDEFPV